MGRLMRWRQAMMSQTQREPRLPAEYQEVEYLERTDVTSSGPYIITNIYGDNTLDFSIKAMCYDYVARTYFGSRRNYDVPDAKIYNLVSGQGGSDRQYGRFGFGNHVWYYWPAINNIANEIFTAQKVGDTVTSSGGANFSVAGETEFSTPYTLEIFAMSTSTQSRHNLEGLNGRIYSLSFSRNRTLIADFVPCYRKADNKPGMYDLCGSICDLTNSPFYVSANNGEFTIGQNVT